MKTQFLARYALLTLTLSAASAVCVAPFPLVVPALAAPAKVPAALLITPKSIGPARLGRSVGALKRAFPGSVVYFDKDSMFDHYALKKNGKELLYFSRVNL